MQLSKRIQLLWAETGNAREGAPEPGDVRFRTLVLTMLMLVGPPLLLICYFKTRFVGLINPEALDYAQVGRNLGAGRGFVTDILRPLALTHGTNPLAQPDVVHSPLYPFVLALAFGVLGVKDTTVAIVSGLFYLLTIPVVYRLGVRVFSRAVGLLSALIFTCNALLLEYAASGGPMMLYIFLTTWLLLIMFNIARATERAPDRFPRNQYLLAGTVTALLYLTEPLFFCIVPFMIGAAYMLSPGHKKLAMRAMLVPMGLLMLPWMARNLMLTGDPVFGLRGMEVWMNTKGRYPGYTGYRLFPAEIIPGAGVLRLILQKVIQGAAEIIRVFPEVTASWVLAFFLPCLLFRFTDMATNALRRVMLLCLLGLFMGAVVFRIQMPLFVAVIPTMLVFSVAYLLYLTQQAQLRRNSLALVTTLMVIAIGLPLISDMVLADKLTPIKEASAARAMQQSVARDETVLSDQPWLVAWYGDRPAVWIPVNDRRIGAVRKRFPKTRWFFLTDRAPAMSPEWASIYDVFSRWNSTYPQAIADNKTPENITITGTGSQLIEGLAGFTSVPPVKGVTLSVVVATLPVERQEIGMRPATGEAIQRQP